MPAATPRLVLFDCDGTLIDSERLALEIDMVMLRDLGVPMGEDEAVELFVGRSHEDVHDELERILGRPLPTDWRDPYEFTYWLEFETRLAPIEGVPEALEQISLPTCVVSNSSHAYLSRCLEITGLLSRFTGRVFSAEDVSKGKPEPDLLLHAASRLGVEPPDCIVVEDSRFGVEAARAAGMHVFAFTAGPTPARLLEGRGTTLFDAMSELPAMIERHSLTVNR
jgi:HAD superfamily hydrolase (TIGR01509 family)